MAQLRSYTTIEQSKKLAEFLPIESADMRYAPFGDTHPWVWECTFIEKDKERMTNSLNKKTMDYKERIIDILTNKELTSEQEKQLETIFPELAESEDEQVRKALIEYFSEQCDMSDWNGIYGYQVVAWLEKQGEQKPMDKVEPKFKNGQWIVWKDKYYKVNYNACGYELFDENGWSTSWDYKTIEDNAHIWTIQDAKDGDVLFQDLIDGKTFIYNGVNPNMAILYSFIINNDGEDVLPYHIGKPNTGIGNIEENKNIIHPATKEQRDILFEKMQEAGYEWDVNKKELKKIDTRENLTLDGDLMQADSMIVESSWSEEDEEFLTTIIDHLREYYVEKKGYPYVANENSPEMKEFRWLNSLKDRIK